MGLDSFMQMHLYLMQMHEDRGAAAHDDATETDQPQALSLRAARGDRARPKSRCRSSGSISILPTSRTGSWRSLRSARRRCCRSATGRFSRLAVILEYLEETQPRPLHPADPLTRARTSRLDRIRIGGAERHCGLLCRRGCGGLRGQDAFSSRERFARLETRVAAAPWFDGEQFCAGGCGVRPGVSLLRCVRRRSRISPSLPASRSSSAGESSLAQRPSVRAAVSPDYPALLHEFLRQAGIPGCRSFRPGLAA